MGGQSTTIRQPFDFRTFFRWLAFGSIGLFLVYKLVGSLGYSLMFNVSPSMEPALYVEYPANGAPQRGDLVTLYPPANPILTERVVKRVVGVEGDTIEIVDSVIYVNGEKIGGLKSVSSKGIPLTAQGQTVVPEHHIFVAGTHELSFDSRYEEFGTVNWGRVQGHAREIF